jgi:hypothetical protein
MEQKMKLTILAASGATGMELTRQALQRGHSVVAIARDPSRIRLPDTSQLTRVGADVHDPASIARAVGDDAIVLSALGVTTGDTAGVLTAGARALVATRPQRILWLGAYGSGTSAAAAGWATRTLLSLLGAKLADKVAADTIILDAHGTVFHAGPLSNGPLSDTRRIVGLEDAPKRFFPARVARATVAAAMLDVAESGGFIGRVAIPLEG